MTIEMEYANTLQTFKLEYAKLMVDFLEITKPYVDGISNVLNDLKNYYSNVINSARINDYINNLEALLRVLEKRNELSYENIKPLIYIESHYVRDPGLEETLKNYEERINDRPVVPYFNIYDLPSGKYNVEDEPSSRNIRLVRLQSPTTTSQPNNNPNIIVRYYTNHDQSTQDITSSNDIMEFSQMIQSTTEDNLLNGSKNFTEKHKAAMNGHASYSVTNFNIFLEANSKKFCNHVMTVTISFLGASVLLITLITVYNSWPSVSSHEDQPGFPGLAMSHDKFQVQQIQAQMSLYTTPEPRFHLRLQGSIGIDPTKERSKEIRNEENIRIVFLELSEKLGRHWRDVVRFLGVIEYDIDEIDCQSQLSLKEKAFKALMKFQSKTDSSQWKSKLQRALEKARRRDLMEMVEDLWSREHR